MAVNDAVSGGPIGIGVLGSIMNSSIPKGMIVLESESESLLGCLECVLRLTMIGGRIPGSHGQ